MAIFGFVQSDKMVFLGDGSVIPSQALSFDEMHTLIVDEWSNRDPPNTVWWNPTLRPPNRRRQCYKYKSLKDHFGVTGPREFRHVRVDRIIDHRFSDWTPVRRFVRRDNIGKRVRRVHEVRHCRQELLITVLFDQMNELCLTVALMLEERNIPRTVITIILMYRFEFRHMCYWYDRQTSEDTHGPVDLPIRLALGWAI